MQALITITSYDLVRFCLNLFCLFKFRNNLKSYKETKKRTRLPSEFWYTQIDFGKQFAMETFSSNNDWFQTNIMSESVVAVEV